MERSGGRRALLRGEGLSDTEPREREFHGGHCGAESLGGVAFLLRDGLLGFTLAAAGGTGLAGVVGGGGCCGHRGVCLHREGSGALGHRREQKTPWLVAVFGA